MYLVIKFQIKSKINFFSVDGNWSGWKPWGPCTKSCGRGSQTSSRSCTNPPPTNGGEECRGVNERSRDCNTQPCPGKINNSLYSLNCQKILGFSHDEAVSILLHSEFDRDANVGHSFLVLNSRREMECLGRVEHMHNYLRTGNTEEIPLLFQSPPGLWWTRVHWFTY